MLFPCNVSRPRTDIYSKAGGRLPTLFLLGMCDGKLIVKYYSIYSVHKKYGNSNSCVHFNTNISIFNNVIDTANRKYPFPSPYQISDTFVRHLGILWPLTWQKVVFLKVRFHSLNWNRHFPLWFGIYTSNIGFWLLIVTDRDVVTEHQKVSNQSNLHLFNEFHSWKYNVDVIHSVKMLQG